MFEYCVIGGGVVGTSIFNKLVRLGKRVILLEKENDVGFGASRANTALIHSGIDCNPGTLKAKLNVRGSLIFEDIATRLGVPYLKTGHLIVGNDEEKLNKLLLKAQANNIVGVKKLDYNKLHKMEPNLSAEIQKGLYVPSGAIIESYNLAVAFAEEGIINGGCVELEFDTKKITRTKTGFVLLSSKNKRVEAKCIINAAGNGFNEINKLMKAEQYNYEFRRGEYYVLDKSEAGFVTRPVFQLPTEKTKGVVVAPTIHGNILVGPTSIVGSTSTKTSVEGLDKIKNEVLVNFPSIPLHKNIRVFSGVRGLVGDDFIIEHSAKMSGLINVAGICSPGLSACPAIAEYVASLCGLDINSEIKGLKRLPKKICVENLSEEEQNKLIKKHPDYGKVVCKCENISLGEIKDAVQGILPAKSVDAVKRRTRAGMGRCQSGFCIFEVMECISKYSGEDFSKIKKDGVGSEIIKSDIKS